MHLRKNMGFFVNQEIFNVISRNLDLLMEFFVESVYFCEWGGRIDFTYLMGYHRQ